MIVLNDDLADAWAANSLEVLNRSWTLGAFLSLDYDGTLHRCSCEYYSGIDPVAPSDADVTSIGPTIFPNLFPFVSAAPITSTG